MKKASQASVLSVENSHNSSPKKIIEAKDRWVRVRVRMDAAAAGHVMIDGMLLGVKSEREPPLRRQLCVGGGPHRGRGTPTCGELGTSEVFSHRLHTSMTRGTADDSTAGLGQTLRTGRPLVGGLSFHDVYGLCTSSLAHRLPGGIQAQGMRKRPMQAFA